MTFQRKELSITQKRIKQTILILFLLLSSIVNGQNVFINEFMASNVTASPEIVDFDDYSDWIEVYNDSTEEINIGGYYITDDLNNPTRWQIPTGTIIQAKGYLIFWADGYDTPAGNGIKYNHLNFKLSKAGEEIGLFSSSEELLDSISFGLQISDVSYGRKTDADSGWYYFGEPTPGGTNDNGTGTLNLDVSDSPKISIGSGFYSGTQSVAISTNETNAKTTYTMDGSKPGINSSEYSSQVTITENTTLRVRVFGDDKLPSKIITKSYFIDQIQKLPILSLTVFPETFFDNEIGIYDNEIKAREVPINVQLFERGGDLAFEVDAGVRLTGQASFQYPQKPLTIETDDRFGYEQINYPVFHNRPFDNYKSIYLRNSGTQDNRHTMFRDALQHTIVINQMDIDCQAYQPAATYINGKYWGIYNVREKLDEYYIKAHHDVDIENIDYLEYDFNSEPVVLNGSVDEYYNLQNFLANNSMNIEENWNYVKSQIDVNEVMNYLITEIYCDNVNWPYTNSRWWKEKSENGKWRYIFLDSDYGFGAPSWSSHYSNNTLNFLYNQPSYSTFVFRKLFENKDFKNEFIQRFATYLSSTFSKNRVVGIVDSLKDQIEEEMVYHIDRWNDDPTPIYGYPPIPDIPTWNAEVNILREFADKRPEYMKQHIIDFYKLAGSEKIKFNLSNQNSGNIKITGIKVEDGFEGEYFRYIPIKLEAIPEIGFRFVKWIGVPDSNSRVTNYSPTRSDSTIQITAVFELENISILPKNFTENTLLDLSSSPFYAKGNVIVDSGITLTVEAGVEIIMPEKARIIVKGNLNMNGNESQPILIKPNYNAGHANWGYIYFDSSSAQSTIKYVELIKATQHKSDSSKIGAISSYKSDLIIENVKILDAPFPIFAKLGNVVVRNCKLHSEKTCDLINIKNASSALVENCEFIGNDAFDTDAIDFDGITNGIIRGNKIYNFYGFNSDGIDLGEGSKDIEIYDNFILNCTDKGISVGQASTTNIKQNIIISCAQGVGVKDAGSYAFVDRNTFMDCEYGVASFEKNLGAGGGNIEIINSIFSKSVVSPTFVDYLSILKVSFSLSDTDPLDGLNNLNSSPQFTNNFILSSKSPAVNSGSPLTERDPDGTIADLGAKYFNGVTEPLVINEIHYNPPEGETREFIEIFNSGNAAMDISGFKIRGAIDFTFPLSTIISPKEYIVLVKTIPTGTGFGVQTFVWGDPELPNKNGNLIIEDASGNEIDFVGYSNKHNWPTAADGMGYSIELRNPNEENIVTRYWKASGNYGGSPGRENRLLLNGLVYLNEIQADNKKTIKDENDEYDDWVEIYNASDHAINLGGLYITDDYNNLTKHIIPFTNDENVTVAGKSHLILWADGEIDQGSNHLNFRLNSAGEQVALVYVFENDTTIIDSITFGNLEPDFSFARKEDGSPEWEIKISATPNEPNSDPSLFKNGILLVNGFRFSIDLVKEAYANQSFWKGYNIKFWDLLAEPTSGYPFTLPEPIGHGAIPLDTLTNYSTIIWTGENNSSELNAWNNTKVLDYVKRGGNVVLLLKSGREYLSDEMVERIGLHWTEPTISTIQSCYSVYNGLDSMIVIQPHFSSSLFDTSFTESDSKLLFTESTTYNKEYGIGVWNKPANGGWYNENGGQVILISGRAYLYDNYALRDNIDFILENFLEEKKIISSEKDDKELIPTSFALKQNYPNPFNPTTTIKYQIPMLETLHATPVQLKVFDILGREIRILVDQKQKPGIYEVNFNASNIPSGVYFYRISASNFTDVKKMILLK